MITSQSGPDNLLIVTGTNLPVCEGTIVTRFMRVYEIGGAPNRCFISKVFTGDFASARAIP